MGKVVVNAEMQDAGAEALLEALPAELLEERGIDARRLVTSIFTTMATRQWHPIATAPRSTADNVMLGYFGPQGFTVGIGRYVPDDDDVGPGKWSTESWWGSPPTHWLPIPPSPPRPSA